MNDRFNIGGASTYPIHTSHKYLFPDKVMYELSCTSSGKLRYDKSIKTFQRKKQVVNNLHLTNGLSFTDKSFAMLQPYNGPVDFDICPYCKYRKSSGSNTALHFFQDDYTFKTLWDNLETASYKFRKFDYIFTPDYSMYLDAPDHINRDAVYKNRAVGAIWQQKFGFNVIPTFSFGPASSFSYCFDGLPEYSVLAVEHSSVGHTYPQRKLFQKAIETVVSTKHPTTLIVYGFPLDFDPKVPVKYFECNIQKLRAL